MSKKLINITAGVFTAVALILSGNQVSPTETITERTNQTSIIAQRGDTRWNYAKDCDCLEDIDPRIVVYELGQINHGQEPVAGKPYTIFECNEEYDSN